MKDHTHNWKRHGFGHKCECEMELPDDKALITRINYLEGRIRKLEAWCHGHWETAGQDSYGEWDELEQILFRGEDEE